MLPTSVIDIGRGKIESAAGQDAKIINGITLTFGVICLAISRYVLNLDSALADNISANVIGVGLGTIFRFWSYRTIVFKPH